MWEWPYSSAWRWNINLRANCLVLAVFSAALAGCSGDSRDLEPVRLLHSPPVAQLTPQQLRTLSLECEKYSRNDSMRGPYDAEYCEEAMAAWGDSPLQMVIIAPDANPANPSKKP
jgi:hypothetical protein